MKPHRVVTMAIVFEAALGAAGCIITQAFGIPLAPRLELSSDTIVRSLVALVPMLALLWFGLRSTWGPLARLRELVESLVGQLFAAVPWWGLAAVATAAGVGEELLFRGALQPLAERGLGPTAGLILVSIVFGALHAASPTYFVLATIVGAYLGWLAQRYDDLITPMTIHAVYDFVALMALTKLRTTAPDRL